MSGKVIYEVGGETRTRYQVEVYYSVTGAWLHETEHSTEEEAIESANGFHRRYPDMKYRVIDTWPELDDEYEYRHVCRRTSGCGEE